MNITVGHVLKEIFVKKNVTEKYPLWKICCYIIYSAWLTDLTWLLYDC